MQPFPYANSSPSRCISRGLVGAHLLMGFVWLANPGNPVRADGPYVDGPDYGSEIQPLLTQYCVGCHNAAEFEGGLQMHSYAAMVRGGDSGNALLPGKPEESLIWRRVGGLEEPAMPPPDSAQPSPEEKERLRSWIEAGAVGSDADLPLALRWRVPSSEKAFSGPSPLTAVALVGSEPLVMLGRYDAIEIQQGQWRARADLDIIGKVTQIHPSRDGRFLAIATGIPGVGGQAIVVDAVSVGSASVVPRVLRRVEGHRDILYAATVSPDGRFLATAGYDRTIRLWDMATGETVRAFEGHNGAIYDLDFDPTGTVLASASADETIKIWHVETGERLDTFGQCEAEQYVVRFSPDGETVLAAGADRRVRTWRLQSREKASVSPMLRAVFAHEAPVNQLSISPDGAWVATAGEDLLIKLWRASDWSLMGVFPKLDDVASGLVWMPDGRQLVSATFAGTLAVHSVESLLRVPSPSHSLGEAPNEVGVKTEMSVASLTESEGRRTPATPQPIPLPARIEGVLTDADMHGDDAGDWYALDAKQGESWVLSIDAARSGSPLDSLIDLYDAQGQPVLRTRLQAVRESYFTFRGKDSTNIDDFRLHRWEDMELNQWLYAGGEVVKLWLYPRGPDSGFKVYPGFGNRFTFFGTSATSHALNEPAWIVEELPPNQEPIANGLPVFPIFYSNDDDPSRESGKDSKLLFQAPATGRYLVRVRDTRGRGGEAFRYQLLVVAPQPRFEFSIDAQEVVLRPGVGTEFRLAAKRWDGLDGPIALEFVELPDGISAAAGLTIERDQLQAIAQLRYDEAAYERLPKEFEVVVRASAQHAGREIAAPQERRLKVKLSDKPAMRLKIVARDASLEAPPLEELRIRAGTTVTAQLVIERAGQEGDIAFGGDDSGRNLPHGCFVDNIGLNGLLLPAGQSTREVFITAAPTTHPQERLFHLRAQVDGNPTTLPVKLIVE